MESNPLLEGTGRGLILFLNHAASNGLMNANTAGGLRAACRDVLSSVERDGWESVDVQTIGVDDFLGRFERLRAGKRKPATLTVYKARFANGIQMYREFLEDPTGWRYRPERPASARQKSAGRSATTIRETESRTSATAAPTSTRASTIEYPFPLRPGLIVSLRLPADLTKPEADRRGLFIDSLAIEPIQARGPDGD